MKVLPDSSAWIDFLQARRTPQTDVLRHCLEEREVLVADLVMVEVLQGARDDVGFARTKSILSRLAYVELCNRDIAIKAASNYRLLRQRGITIRGTIDVIVATWCIENDIAIIHNDRDMRVMERELGLKAYA